MSLIDELTQIVSAEVTQQTSQKTGLNQNVAAQMMPMAMAVLMNGLKKNAATPHGAEALSNALENHDGGLLDNLGSLSDDNVLADGQKILDHILGAKRGQAETALAQAAGVKQDQIGSLLAMAAPAVLASLGKMKREQGLDASSLAKLVAKEGAHAQTAAPNELGGLLQFLDADGDGDFKDDLLEGVGKSLLNSFFGKR